MWVRARARSRDGRRQGPRVFLLLALSRSISLSLSRFLSIVLSCSLALSLSRSLFLSRMSRSACLFLTLSLLLSLVKAVFNEDGTRVRNSSSKWCLHDKTTSLANPANVMVPKRRIEKRPLLKVGMYASPPMLRLREGAERESMCILAT
jgi:hypothetical protein